MTTIARPGRSSARACRRRARSRPRAPCPASESTVMPRELVASASAVAERAGQATAERPKATTPTWSSARCRGDERLRCGDRVRERAAAHRLRPVDRERRCSSCLPRLTASSPATGWPFSRSVRRARCRAARRPSTRSVGIAARVDAGDADAAAAAARADAATSASSGSASGADARLTRGLLEAGRGERGAHLVGVVAREERRRQDDVVRRELLEEVRLQPGRAQRREQPVRDRAASSSLGGVATKMSCSVTTSDSIPTHLGDVA